MTYRRPYLLMLFLTQVALIQRPDWDLVFSFPKRGPVSTSKSTSMIITWPERKNHINKSDSTFHRDTGPAYNSNANRFNISSGKIPFRPSAKTVTEKRDKNHTAAPALSHNLISFFKFLSSFWLSNGYRQSVPERVPEGLPGMVQLGWFRYNLFPSDSYWTLIKYWFWFLAMFFWFRWRWSHYR